MASASDEDALIVTLQERLGDAINDVLAEGAPLPSDPVTAVALRLLQQKPPSEGADAVRQVLFSCARTIRECQNILDAQHPSPVAPPSRSGFLQTLSKLVGPMPDHSWRDEWTVLNQETARLHGWDIPTKEDLAGDGKFSVSTKFRNYASQISYKVDRGWEQDDAEAHVALSGVCCIALADSIKNQKDCFAASVHALYNALARASQKADPDLNTNCSNWESNQETDRRLGGNQDQK